MNKLELRKRCRLARSAIPITNRLQAAHSLAKLFATLPLFKQQHFACYIAFRDELDLDPLIHLLWQANKNVYLPVLVAESGQPSLIFSAYAEGDALAPNRFGILEPQKIEKTHRLDVVLTPLVAFDREGNRLGTGGGYYDATFKNKQNCKLIGVGYVEQEVDFIPADKWDIKLNGIITPKEFITPNRKSESTL